MPFETRFHKILAGHQRPTPGSLPLGLVVHENLSILRWALHSQGGLSRCKADGQRVVVVTHRHDTLLRFIAHRRHMVAMLALWQTHHQLSIFIRRLWLVINEHRAVLRVHNHGEEAHAVVLLHGTRLREGDGEDVGAT